MREFGSSGWCLMSMLMGDKAPIVKKEVFC
jgi:hypothetical protein